MWPAIKSFFMDETAFRRALRSLGATLGLLLASESSLAELATPEGQIKALGAVLAGSALMVGSKTTK